MARSAFTSELAAFRFFDAWNELQERWGKPHVSCGFTKQEVDQCNGTFLTYSSGEGHETISDITNLSQEDKSDV